MLQGRENLKLKLQHPVLKSKKLHINFMLKFTQIQQLEVF